MMWCVCVTHCQSLKIAASDNFSSVFHVLRNVEVKWLGLLLFFCFAV